MEIGIMARTFVKTVLEECLDAVVSHGIHHIQFSFSCVGLPDLPDHIDKALFGKIRKEMKAREINMSAVSGTFNMIHPDVEKRQDGLKRLSVIAIACHEIDTSVITLCTGSRDRDSMWRRHPDNDLPDAWDDLIATTEKALKIAEENDVILAFEPEVSNVIDSAVKGRRFLDEMKSKHLKVVMDPANIFHKGELPRMKHIIDEAFELLAKDIVIAHGKDLDHDGEAGHVAAGTGLLDYDQYISLLSKVGFDVPVILHGLSENQVGKCVQFLKEKIENNVK